MNTFYEKNIKSSIFELSEEEAKHALVVLRLKSGDEIRILDGNGGVYRAVLTQVDKKKCVFAILEEFQAPLKPFRIHLAIAPTKNADRMEWMVEKLGEIGVDELTFITTAHSERTKLRLDRLEKKAISAMKQSGNPFLMRINATIDFKSFISTCTEAEKYIAHVSPDHTYLGSIVQSKKSAIVLIGPEGDFSLEEVNLAIQKGFKPVSLGKNVLRTETAGLIGCQMINVVNGW
jgi:16S rRNA (uracil1498-N3)-methyltransferase